MTKRYATSIYENQARTAMVLTDDGKGGLLWGGQPLAGSRIDYETGETYLEKSSLKQRIKQPTYTAFQLSQGANVMQQTVEGTVSIDVLDVQLIAPNSATVYTITASDTRTISEKISTGLMTYDLLADKAKPCAILLNSWIFEINGVRAIERNGVIYSNWNELEGKGNVVGSLSATGELVLRETTAQAPVIKIVQGVYINGDYQVQKFVGRTQTAPLKPQSFSAYAETGGQTLVGKAQANENLLGELTGKAENATGYFEIQSNQPIAPDSLRYNAVSQSTVPLDSTIIGINANRLPLDGKVPIFRRGDLIVIGNHFTQDIGSAHIAGQSIELTRKNIDRLCVLDADNKHINAELYDVDLEAGTMTWATPLDLSQYKMPIKTKQIWEEENRVTDVDIVSGTLKLQFAVSRDYPVENTYVSSAIVGGNMEVRATQPFSQKAWTNVWQDTRIGDPILANINTADYPIELTSDGAITERWLMKFKNTTQFELFGERLGLVAESDIYTDLAPINPATQKPYFKLPALAMGGGFAVQNCVRFNTTGTPLPVWVVRAVQPSANREIKRDGFALCLRGNTIEK